MSTGPRKDGLHMKWEELIMTYMQHLSANARVSGRALVMAIFHILHGIIPCRFTSHEYWGW